MQGKGMEILFKLVQIKDLAQRQDITIKYAEQIISLLLRLNFSKIFKIFYNSF